ncbi:MAG: hypothetical protein AAB832_00595, partial [Patescibacteria group bacterium]
MKRTNKFIAAVFIIAGLILIFGKREWFPEFYRPQFMGIIAFVSALLIILPRFIFKPSSEELNKQKSLNIFQAVLVAGLVLNSLGGLGLYQLYKIGLEYDKFLHFMVPFLFVMAFSRFGFDWYGWSFGKSIILAAVLVIFGGFFWELFEFFGDKLLKTEMSGYYGKFIIKDTVWDSAMNFFGVIGGILSFVFINPVRNR